MCVSLAYIFGVVSLPFSIILNFALVLIYKNESIKNWSYEVSKNGERVFLLRKCRNHVCFVLQLNYPTVGKNEIFACKRKTK